MKLSWKALRAQRKGERSFRGRWSPRAADTSCAKVTLGPTEVWMCQGHVRRAMTRKNRGQDSQVIL